MYAAAAHAQEPASEETAAEAAAAEPIVFDSLAWRAFVDSLEAPLDWHTGVIELGDGVASIDVPEGYRYLDLEDARYVLEELWGNPPADTWGMLFPAEAGPLDAGWGIDITYLADGYISDDDAGEIDYDELLGQLQADTRAENEQRREQGYEGIELIGWASAPYYDAEAKKLHWAKELAFGHAEGHTLNYNIRVLGRRGVLMLNAIGDMSELASVEAAVPPVLASVAFSPGHRYSDFDPEIDEVAAYGIAGLVAGKVLTKTGFFVLLAKFWKVIAAAGIGLFAFLRKFVFGRKQDEDEQPKQPAGV